VESTSIYEPADPVSDKDGRENNGEPSLQTGTEQNFWEKCHNEIAGIWKYGSGYGTKSSPLKYFRGNTVHPAR
jgi:hypothetical protein